MTGLAGLAVVNAGFSGEACFSGDRGSVRELADRGESTVGGAFCDAVRVAFVFAVAVAVFVRFFGFGKSCAHGSVGAFSLSSSAKCSLGSVSHFKITCRGARQYIPAPLQTLPDRRRRRSLCLLLCYRYWRCRLGVVLCGVLVDKVLDVALSQRLRYSVHTHLESRSQTLRL